jgi:hypothetical protein
LDVIQGATAGADGGPHAHALVVLEERADRFQLGTNSNALIVLQDRSQSLQLGADPDAGCRMV